MSLQLIEIGNDLPVMVLEELLQGHDGADDKGEFGDQEGLDGEESNTGQGQHPPADLRSHQEGRNEELHCLLLLTPAT